MNTATHPTEQTPVQEVDFAAEFFGDAPASTPSVTPAPAEESGPTATPDASAVSTEAAKSEAPPAGKEDKPKSDDEKHMAAARRLGQEVSELKKQFDLVAEENRILKAKLDGTYEEPPKETPEDVAARERFKGKEEASRAVAISMFGEEALKEQVYAPESPFKQLVADEKQQSGGPSWSYLEVVTHPQPPVAAMHLLARRDFITQYGEDPRQWKSKIEAELEPIFLEKFKKQAAAPLTGAPAPTVSDARGSGGRAREKSVEELFYGEES